MGRLGEGLNGGLQVVQAYADSRDGNTKRNTLLVLTTVVLLWWLASALYGLFELQFSFFIFASFAVLISAIGVHATWKRRRPLLCVYMVGVVVVMGFVVVGLVIYTITGVFTLSLNGTFLVALLIDLAILLIEGLSVVLAFSLTKDLDPKRVVVVGSSAAPSDQQQEFTFLEGAGAVEMQAVGGTHGPAQAYQPHQAMAAPHAVPGVYNPVTGTFSLPQLQPPMAGYPVAAPYSNNPYGHIAMGYPPQGMGYSPAGTAYAQQIGDRYDLPESRPVYENDIIGGAVDTTNLMADQDTTNPFAAKS